MKIRTKIILSLATIAIGIVIASLFFLFIKSEQTNFLLESYRKGLGSAAGNALLAEQKLMNALVKNKVARDHKPSFTQTLFFDRNNKPIFLINPEEKKKGDPWLFNDAVYSYISSQNSGYFFHKHEQHIYEIAFSAISAPTDTLAVKPVSGYFLLYKAMDSALIDHLGKISGSKTTLLSHPDFQSEKTVDGEIAALIPLTGWDGQAVGYLKFQQYHPEIRSYLNTINTFGLLYFILVFTLLASFSLQFFGWLNHPLKKITESLALENSSPIKKLALKNNEFGDIARMIDRFFEQKKELAAIIHEKNEALNALTDAESKNRIILSAIPDHLFRINFFGVITDVHINAPDEFIPETHAIIGKNFEEVVPSNMAPTLKKTMQAVSENGQPQSFDFSLDRKNHRSKYYEVQLSLTKQGDYLAIVRDISTRKEAELTLYRMVEKEADLNRLKTHFITTVSHEFRTPLSAISSNIQLIDLYDEKWPAEKKATVLGRIQDAVAQMTTLLDDLSTVAKDESGKFKLSLTEFDLENFCREIVQQATNLTGFGPSVICNFQCKERKALLDKQLLFHILKNLIANALKFSPTGQPVLFHVEDTGMNQISFSLQDHGIGIPEEDLANIFEPFHRGTNAVAYPGTGLGLSIVKRCVDQHQGSITIRSQLGSGTTVTVLLPGRDCKT